MTRLAALLVAGFAAASPVASAAELTIDRLFAAPNLSGATLMGARFSPDGRYVAYLKGKTDARDTFDLWAFDLKERRHRLLVDSAGLETAGVALSAEEVARRERQRTSAFSGIVEFSFSSDGRQVLVPLGGDLYLCELGADGAAVRRLTRTEAYETDARFSPRGRYVSFIRDANLVVLEVASGREQAITRDGAGPISFGVAEFIAQEEMNRSTGYWWSPDDARIAYTRIDESPVPEVERFEIFAEEVRVVRQRFPAAGGPNVLVTLHVAELAGGAPVTVDLGADTDIYLARVDWFPDGRSLAVQRQSRDQKTLTLLAADAATGRTRELVVERSDTWVDLHDELRFTSDRGDFLWASSRSGHRHLYAYDAEGRLLRPVTQGEWMVVADGGFGGEDSAIRGVDRARGLVWFLANRESPIERHLYVTSWRNPGEPRRVTEAAGWHDAVMSKDHRVWLDYWSSPRQPPTLTLRRTSDGRPIEVLSANALDAAHPYAPYLAAHQEPEFGTLRAADGQVMHWSLLRPRPLEPGKRYPVIVSVYGGPGVQRVRRAWGDLFNQYLAQQGYVVFTLDNRGTGLRGVAFESALYRRMGDVETADQVAGVEFLRSLPFVDPARIGVWGWSYGGYMALNAMTRAPDHFRAGVAGAPVTDWRLYDTHYTERFMGTPADNVAGYASSRVMTHAAGLRGPLLVMHGMADDNVLFTHSTALFQSLQDLGKTFAVMPYPGLKHGLIRQSASGRHAFTMIEEFFDQHL
jgi:dipeptidyl-peptidase-4